MFKKFLALALLVSALLVCIINPSSVQAQIQTAQMDELKVELTNASFQKSKVKRLFVGAKDINFNSGRVASLFINTLGFNKNEIILDEFNLTLNDLLFDPQVLLSNHQLLLTKSVTAQADIILTQKTLNNIINQPSILNRMKISLAKGQNSPLPIGGLSTIVFTNPQITILPNNTIQVDMVASLGGLMNFPTSLISQVTVNEGAITLYNSEIIASGFPLHQSVSGIIATQLNKVLDVSDKLKDDFDIKVRSIQLLQNERIVIKADAYINKLDFGKLSKNN